jgi:hypothetical protein
VAGLHAVEENRIVADQNAAAIEALLRLINDVKFGTVHVIIQDGRIVQVDKTEKIRLK